MASAMPIEFPVNGLPVGPITCAPEFRQRAANGMSEVTTMSLGPARSAIQSSAASKPDPTTTRSMSGSRGTRIALFDTTCTTMP